MTLIVKYVHLLSIAIWTGSIVFFSFIGAPAVFKALDRQTAGDVVGEIFPKYFLLGQSLCALALASLAYIGHTLDAFGNSAVRAGIAILIVMGAIAVYSGNVNGPEAREVKRLVRVEQDAAKKEELRKKFGRLHGISVILNIITLALGLVLLWLSLRYLAI
ncbi:MAG: DUF4149 domain-containing protein [Nitrospinae bacterium]|nr:DUF4149 domain-containing protein [Nitrospinota bacterium]